MSTKSVISCAVVALLLIAGEMPAAYGSGAPSARRRTSTKGAAGANGGAYSATLLKILQRNLSESEEGVKLQLTRRGAEDLIEQNLIKGLAVLFFESGESSTEKMHASPVALDPDQVANAFANHFIVQLGAIVERELPKVPAAQKREAEADFRQIKPLFTRSQAGLDSFLAENGLPKDWFGEFSLTSQQLAQRGEAEYDALRNRAEQQAGPEPAAAKPAAPASKTGRRASGTTTVRARSKRTQRND